MAQVECIAALHKPKRDRDMLKPHFLSEKPSSIRLSLELVGGHSLFVTKVLKGFEGNPAPSLKYIRHVVLQLE